MNYSIQKRVAGTFAEAVEKTKAALATEGFGVLTEIDVAATMKKKLDVEYENYVILGACNPTLAHQALQAEKEIGLFLPCNVIVYEHEGGVVVSAIRPTTAMSMVSNEWLGGIAREAEKRLRAAVESI